MNEEMGISWNELVGASPTRLRSAGSTSGEIESEFVVPL